MGADLALLSLPERLFPIPPRRAHTAECEAGAEKDPPQGTGAFFKRGLKKPVRISENLPCIQRGSLVNY